MARPGFVATLADGRPRCQAKSKRSGIQCNRCSEPDMRVCRVHGGATPKGPASPNWKHGRHSKHAFIPQRLLQHYRASLEDPELIALRKDIALSDAVVLDILQKFDAGESAAVWRRASRALGSLREAQRDGDDVGVLGAITELAAAVEAGRADAEARGELREQMDLGRRLRDTERRRLEGEQSTITVERMLGMATRFAEILREAQLPREVLARVLGQMQREVTLIGAAAVLPRKVGE